MLFRIILGIIISGLGVLMVIKTEKFVAITGPIAWAEDKLGGTRTFYKLGGVVLIFLGFMFMTGMLGDAFVGVFGSLGGQ